MTTLVDVADLSQADDTLTFGRFVQKLRDELGLALTTACISLFGTAGVLSLVGPSDEWVRWIITFAIPIMCEGFLGVFLFYRSRYVKMGKQRDTFRGIAHQRNLEAQEAERHVSRSSAELEVVKTYFGIADLSEIETVLPMVQDASVQQLRQEAWKATESLAKLIQERTVTATYEEQLIFAELFANQARRYFRATCFDKPSEFEGRNFYYLDNLDRLPERLPVSESGGLPSIGRIFIGEARDLVADIESESIRILDLHERHLRWGRAIGLDSTMRFLLIPHDQYRLFLQKAGIINPLDIIDDFMVVDDRFVYGRREGPASPRVQLGYLDDAELVKKYNAVYGTLWRASKTIEQVAMTLRASFPGQERDLKVFLEQCDKRGSKLEVMHDYAELFPEYERRGESFFSRVCDVISGGLGYCFAVDRADKKEGSLWKIWRESPYREFREASKTAAHSAAMFQRLFILQKWPKPDERELAGALIREFVCANLQIGFLHVQDADLEELTEKFDTDFIVVGVDASCKSVRTGFGFELQQQNFDVEQLHWIKNLIAKVQLPRQAKIFHKLWDKPGTVKVSSSDEEEIATIVELLIEKGVKGDVVAR